MALIVIVSMWFLLRLAVAAKIVRFFYRFKYTIPALTIGEGVLRVSAVIAYGSVCPLIPFGVLAVFATRHDYGIDGGSVINYVPNIPAFIPPIKLVSVN